MLGTAERNKQAIINVFRLYSYVFKKQKQALKDLANSISEIICLCLVLLLHTPVDLILKGTFIKCTLTVVKLIIIMIFRSALRYSSWELLSVSSSVDT